MKEAFWRSLYRMPDGGGGGGGTGAATGAGAAGGEDSGAETGAGTQPRTLDEVLSDKTLQAEFDKRVSKALTTAKSKWEKEQTMTAEQLAQTKLQESMDALNAREAEISRRELRAKALNALSEKKLPGELIDAVNLTDENGMTASIGMLEKVLHASVESAVKERLKGGTPPAGAPAQGGKAYTLADVQAAQSAGRWADAARMMREMQAKS